MEEECNEYEISMEDLEELLEGSDDDQCDYTMSDIEILKNTFSEEFSDGIEYSSSLAGKMYAASLTGLNPKDMLDYILQMESMKHERHVLRETNKIALMIAELELGIDTKIEGFKMRS